MVFLAFYTKTCTCHTKFPTYHYFSHKIYFVPFYPQNLLIFSSWCHPLRWCHPRRSPPPFDATALPDRLSPLLKGHPFMTSTSKLRFLIPCLHVDRESKTPIFLPPLWTSTCRRHEIRITLETASTMTFRT